MSKHTHEPWFRDETSIGSSASDQLNSGYFTADCLGPDAAANARRIVACVNACAGMETEHLESQAMLGETLLDRFGMVKRETDELTKQRDELLAALTYSRGMLSSAAMSMKWFSIPKAQEILREIDAVDNAIAKAKGGAE